MKKLTALCFSFLLVQNCNSGKKSTPHTASSSKLRIEGGGTTPMGAESVGTGTAKQIKAEAKAEAKAAKAATKAEARAARAAAKAARRKARKGLGLASDDPADLAAQQNIATMLQEASTNGSNHIDKVFSEEEVNDMVDLIQADANTELLTVNLFISTMEKIAGGHYSAAGLSNIVSVLTAISKNYEKSDDTLDTQDLTDLLNGWDAFIGNYAKTAQ